MRLGRRPDPRSTHLDISGAPLVAAPAQPIAHVALVYTPAEETGPDALASLETLVQGAVSFEHYTSLISGLRMLGVDVAAIIHPPPSTGPPVGGNVPRRDFTHHTGAVRRLLEHVHGGDAPVQPSSLDVLRTVEDDVAGYVVRNELRERVRDFVREVLIRLNQRGDVAQIVINSHSQGTVAAFDTLRTVPYEVVDMVSAWFTLGSPLRKYAETLSWGRDTGRISAIRSGAWTNIWDPLDPVADPLQPAPPWRRGTPVEASTPSGLFLDVDPQTGAATPHPLNDLQVDNVHHVVGGGLRSHDYWDNAAEVVPRIAATLR